MKFKQILVFGIVMILMTGALSTQAASLLSYPAREPWLNEIVDDISQVSLGQHVSIDHYDYNGRAYVSYYDETNGNLKLAYEVDPGSGNCPENADWNCELVDDGQSVAGNRDVGLYSSIDLIDEMLNLPDSTEFHYPKIGISYYDADRHSLNFAQKSCVLSKGVPSCSWTITEVDHTSSDSLDFTPPYLTGKYSSMYYESDGKPVIFYQVSMGSTIGKVKRAKLTTNTMGSCESGWMCDVIAEGNQELFGKYISAAGGMVAFYDGSQKRLVLAQPFPVGSSGSCGLPNNWYCLTIDDVDDVGRSASLHYDGSHPLQVAYYDAKNGRVKFAVRVGEGKGNCGTENTFRCIDVDTATNWPLLIQFLGLSLTLDAGGRPVIAYQKIVDGESDLMLARPAYVYGNDAGNCGGYPPGSSSIYWQCDVLDDGASFSNEGDYVAISVNPTGLAAVAYYEFNEFYNRGRLKVAQQHFTVYLSLIMK